MVVFGAQHIGLGVRLGALAYQGANARQKHWLRFLRVRHGCSGCTGLLNIHGGCDRSRTQCVLHVARTLTLNFGRFIKLVAGGWRRAFAAPPLRCGGARGWLDPDYGRISTPGFSP